MGLKAETRDHRESEVRRELAALYRAFVLYGWTDLVDTHLSARVPGTEGQYLINPYGLLFEEVTASSLLKVSLDGEVVAGDSPYNAAGHLIHSAVLRARPDINFVLHSHTRAGIAVSAMQDGLLPLSQHAGLILGAIAYHDYQNVTAAEDECALLARDLGSKNLMILRNHGLLACGATAAEAFLLHYFLEMSCKVQVDVLGSGAETTRISAAALRDLDITADPARAAAWGEPHWSAVLRKLDRVDPGYRA